MIEIKKKTYTNVEIPTKDFNLKERIEKKEAFEEVIFQITNKKDLTIFVMLSYKEVQLENSDSKNKKNNETRSDEESSEKTEEIGLKRGFNIKKPEPDLPFKKIKDKEKEETKKDKQDWELIAQPLIEHQGIIYFLDNKIHIDENTINLLNVKKSFSKSELIEKEFEIEQIDLNTAQSLGYEEIDFKKDIELSTKEIFDNRIHFPITKIEKKDGEYILELANSKRIIYKLTSEEEKSFVEIINLYEESDYNTFSSSFTT